MKKDASNVVRLAVGTLPLGAMLLCVALWPPLVSSVRQAEGLGEAPVPIPPEGSVAQDFVAADRSLDAVSVMVAKAGAAEGIITVTLSPVTSVDQARESAFDSVQLSSVTDWQNVIFGFPGLETVPGERYAVTVESPQGIYLAAARSDAYPNGVLDSDDVAEGDLIFRVHRNVVMADLFRLTNGLPIWTAALALVGVMAMAGWAVERLLFPRRAGESFSAEAQGAST